ncbi:MAG: LuxR C-terminal-related transcriptional regulator [Bryobacteraceae bacterium]
MSAVRQHLHTVLLEQRAATEELQANNRELAAILEEFLNVRAELRAVAGYHSDGDGFAHLAKHFQPEAAPKTLDMALLLRESDQALRAGQLAVRESLLLRERSRKLRMALRNGFAENHKPAVTDHVSLSKRERQVLSLIVAGRSSKQIAAELGISFKTAVTHRASIMGKLDVHEIASVVREAIWRGLA